MEKSTNQHIISVSRLEKAYKLYRTQKDRVIDAVWPWGQKRHEDFQALRDLSFNVNQGETLGIIGRNGSGKSTLLKIITGVLSPTSGKVTITGRIAALLELGAGFHPEFTGMENIYLNGSLMGMTKAEIGSKIPEILAFADIGEHIFQPVKTYSSGMFVRLAFAIAINVDPDILIVDEALSVGDLFFQIKCYRKFEEFKNAGKTILFVTHDMGTIIKYCDRAIVLEKGHKIGEGSARDMVDLFKKSVSLPSASHPSGNSAKSAPSDVQASKLWKNKFPANPNLQSYGTGSAEIIDYGIFDHIDHLSTTLEKSENCAIRFKVQFNATIESPIFAFTIRDKKGTELCGTNTLLERHEVKTCKAGDILVVTFSQPMHLQGGQYLISLGCTGFDGSGEFVVYSRLYDVLQFEVIATKNSVGFFDLNSHISISHE